MYSIMTGQGPVAIVDICLASAEDICPVSAADICPVSTADVCAASTVEIRTASTANIWRLWDHFAAEETDLDPFFT